MQPIEDYLRQAGLAGKSARKVSPSFYEAFWRPLEDALQGKKRIYVSPDGILNQVALGIVPATDGRLLVERYELHLVSSTKDILRERRAAPRPTRPCWSETHNSA